MRPLLVLGLIAVLAPSASAQRPARAAARADAAPRPAFSERHEDALEASDDSLTSGEFSDTWTFEVAAGQEITAEVVSDAFDPYVILKPPSGAQLDNDDWNGSRRIARVVHPDAVAGTWTALATSFSPGERGRYTLTLSAAYPSGALTSARTRDGLAGTMWAEDCPGSDPSRTFIRFDDDGQFSWSQTSPASVARDEGDQWAVEDGRLVVRWNDSYAVSRYVLDGSGILGGTSSKTCGTGIRLLRMP